MIEFLTSGWLYVAIAAILTFIFGKKVKIDMPKIKRKLVMANLVIDEGQDVIQALVKAITDNPDTKKDEGREITSEEVQLIVKEAQEFVEVVTSKKKKGEV